jgi:cytochrome c biogenesis factor
MRFSAGRLSLVGLALYVGGILWAFTREQLLKRSDPPGWIVDRAYYEPAMVLSWIGAIVLIATVVWVIVRRVVRLIRD